MKLLPLQGRIQKISEGVAITIKKRFSKRIRGARTPLFSFQRRKNWKKNLRGVAVAGSPTAGSATVPLEQMKFLEVLWEVKHLFIQLIMSIKTNVQIIYFP